MSNPINIMAAIGRELCLKAPFERVPEPDMLMSDVEQVEAYASSGRQDGVMAAANLFHSARISQLIDPRATVLDLGCGPATQLAQIAQLNPQASFIGVELSTRMLDNGRAHCGGLGLGNVVLRQDDITALATVEDRSVDAVISTMTLHHLPSEAHLAACFEAVARVLKPGGALYLADFGRLKSPASLFAFAHMHEDSLPKVVVEDYEHSLRAAFSVHELTRLAEKWLPGDATLHATWLVPFMVVIKTGDRDMPAGLGQRLHALRAALSPKFRRELDMLRFFMARGGMDKDPFAQRG